MENKLLIVFIDRVKVKYLECNDIEFRKYVGKVLAGDIGIKHSKIIKNSKNKEGQNEQNFRPDKSKI